MLKDYFKARAIIFIVMVLSVIAIFLKTYKPISQIDGKDKDKKFSSQLNEYFKKKNIKIYKHTKFKYRYNILDRDNIYLLAEKNGVKDIFSIFLRGYDDGSIISISPLRQISNSAMADEFDLFETKDTISYKSLYQNNLSFHIIKNNFFHHFTLKNSENINKIKFKNGIFIIDDKKIDIDNKGLNQFFYILKERFKPVKTSIINSFLKYLDFKNDKKFLSNIKDKFLPMKGRNILNIDKEYIKRKLLYKNGNNLIDYYSLKTVDKPTIELFIFDKKEYFLKPLKSGSYKYSKTGSIVNKNIDYKDSFFIDMKPFGGLKIDSILIRPLLTDCSTIFISPKNDLFYSLGNDHSIPNIDFIQFPYPLIYKNDRSVQIKNLKNNIQQLSKEVKSRSGICFKDNYIIIFKGIMTRSQIMDYSFLVGCDFSFETKSNFLNYEKISKTDNPIFAIRKKDILNDGFKFNKKDSYYIFKNSEITIYKILSSKISLTYRSGKNDPLSNNLNNFSNTERSKKGDIELIVGYPDQITPDGLFFNKKLYYYSQNRSRFFINRERIDIANSSKDHLFYKEGFILYNKGDISIPSEKRYQQIVLGAGIKGEYTYFLQFKKPINFNNMVDYFSKIDIDKGIIFENSITKDLGTPPKILINIDKNYKGIYEY